MESLVDKVDAKNISAGELNDLIMKTSKPFIITNSIEHWEARKWSLTNFTELFGKVQTRFKMYKKKTHIRQSKRQKIGHEEYVPMETECVYQNSSFQDFQGWLNGKKNSLSEKHPREEYWCYADYNYMAELFNNDEMILNAVDWSPFGFPQRNGRQSTIWIGSEGAFTPCHQDTYGLNLVAQIDGVKRWLLIPPSERKHVRPLRIPYEESSVFTRMNSEQLKVMDKCVQELPSSLKDCLHYVEMTIKDGLGIEDIHVTPELLINCLCEKDVLQKVTEKIVQRVKDS
uniref:JmjC domain-containing protein n=1 Tax=Clytia hemisphaerica TaxID=252671 RepID=A0A7M5XF59_9CNID